MTDRAHQVFIDDRYSYIDSLGSGGMARVLLAHDTVLERDVAIKVLHQQYAEDPEFVERFRNEAQSAAALAHPNIVSIYDLGRAEDETYYIAMEYVSGGTLKELMNRSGKLPAGEVASLGAQVAEALGAAHRRDVIHRDIKPQNVLLTERGEAKVADFGIARAVSPMSESRTSLVLGTASYMSPEQAEGKPLGPASDLYSLGVVLYEMLTGGLPFEAETPVAMALKQVSETPARPAGIEPSVPEGLDELVMRLLAKRPADRYQSADEVAEALNLMRGDGSPEFPAVVAPTGDHTPDTGTVDLPTSGGVPRRRQRFPLAILGVLAALGLMAWALSEGLREPPSASGQIEVPELTGMQLTEARGSLEASGLRLGASFNEPGSGAPQGEVVSQSPAAGETVENGSSVDVTVSSGDSDGGDSGGGSESGGSGDGFSGDSGSGDGLSGSGSSGSGSSGSGAPAGSGGGDPGSGGFGGFFDGGSSGNSQDQYSGG